MGLLYLILPLLFQFCNTLEAAGEIKSETAYFHFLKAKLRSSGQRRHFNWYEILLFLLQKKTSG